MDYKKVWISYCYDIKYYIVNWKTIIRLLCINLYKKKHAEGIGPTLVQVDGVTAEREN